MPFDPTRTETLRSMQLLRRNALVLDGAAGTVITVDYGCVWITLERDPRDVVLDAGMRFEIDRGGRTVVVAEQDSLLRLTRPLTPSERVTTKLGATIRQTMRRFFAWQWHRLARQRVPYYERYGGGKLNA